MVRFGGTDLAVKVIVKRKNSEVEFGYVKKVWLGRILKGVKAFLWYYGFIAIILLNSVFRLFLLSSCEKVYLAK